MNSAGGPKLKGVADVVFLLDITGSMQPCIEGLKSNIGAFVERCRVPDSNGSMPITDLRISVCGYRDFPHDPSTWFEGNPFVQVGDSIASIQAQLSALKASGGQDEPESLLDALFKVGSWSLTGIQESTSADKWRANAKRVVIAFTDATYHPMISADEGRGGDYKSVGQLYDNKRIKLIVYAPRHECYDNLCAIDGSILECYTETMADAPNQLKVFTSDPLAFRKALEMMAKTVTVDTPPELL